MITKQDCLSLLFELKENGVECDDKIKKLITLTEPDIQTIKFINTNKELNVRKFYEKLRKSYNENHSKLYVNIVKDNKKDISPKEMLCTLGSLQLQILLFNKSIDDSDFLKHARFDEISKVMLNYFNTKDIVPCIKLLDLVKADLKILEQISK